MALADAPTAAASLSEFPAVPLAGRLLHRVWRCTQADGTTRVEPWFFASVPATPQRGGRFDLPHAVGGTCYLASDPTTAVLEALQDLLLALPVAELQVRCRAELRAPADAPDAADATAIEATGFGVTAGLWADPDRARTQRWATAFRRDGWWALETGAAHEVSGTGRTVALFDTPGEHPPTGQQWHDPATVRLDNDAQLLRDLAARGCRPVTTPNLPQAPDPSAPPA